MKSIYLAIRKPLFIFIDILLLAVSFHIAHLLRGLDYNQTLHDQILLLYSVLSWLFIANITGLYNGFNWTVKKRIFIIVQALILLTLALTFIGFVFKQARYSRLLTAYFIICFSVFLVIYQFLADYLYRKYSERGKAPTRLLIIGAGRIGKQLKEAVLKSFEVNYQLVGFLEDYQTENNKNEKILGKISELENILLKEKVNEIFVALPLTLENLIQRIIETADHYGVRVRLATDISRVTSQPVELSKIGSVTMFHFRPIPLDDPYNRLKKRLFDIFFSGSVLVLTFPVIALAAFLIKITSKGPAFFIQLRTGYNNNDFYCYKIRTMVETDNIIKDTVQAIKDDPRVTPIGKFLRKYNIDELPQFLNVLKGDMSVVGPRPHMLHHTDEFRKRVDRYMVRHLVKPGITGWAQVNGYRGPTDTNEALKKRVEYDLWYMENWSMWLDLKIILKTIFSKQARLNAF
ncbi:MAG: undecaprenyl-phosphate glucose phosphotransferase [Calditrichia bacterium]